MQTLRAMNILMMVLTALSLSVWVGGPAAAGEGAYPPALLAAQDGSVVGEDALSIAGFQAEGTWCRYPNGTLRRAAPDGVFLQMLAVGEVEPNDTTGTAQVIPLGTGGGQDRDLDISGSISIGSDVDFFRFTAAKGDVLGMAALGGGVVNTELGITDTGGTVILSNSDHGGISGIYPANSPFPGGVSVGDSVLTWVAPADGDYLIRMSSFLGLSSGSYTLQIRSRRPGFEAFVPPATQIIFLDFDGATISPLSLFGTGPVSATLSPMTSFLPGWGLSGTDESAVIDAIIATMNENFDDLRTASLNGDRDTDGINGHFDIEIRNSRDHSDPFGQTNVSRLIFGGSISELGISTIGIAQSIDPGNFGTDDTAVILLDLMSGSPLDPNSINSMARDASFSIIDAIGRVVGNVASHEAGHYLGNWHTENTNGIRSIMDQGGNLPVNIAGIGPDNILGTADDEDVDFATDAYVSNEGVATGNERTDVRTAFGLATGAAAPAPVFEGTGNDVVDDSAGNNDGIIDPAETIALTFEVINNGSLPATGVTGTLSSLTPLVSVVASGSNYPNLGIGASGSNATAFSIAVDAGFTCGDSIALQLLVNSTEGSNTIVFDLTTGTTITTTFFTDDMESGTNGWTHALLNTGGVVQDRWAQSTARSSSGTTSWYTGPSENGEGDTVLESPDIDLTAASGSGFATLTFNHWYHFDDCGLGFLQFDGGIIEARVLPGGAWTQIFPTGGYPWTLTNLCILNPPNPLVGFQAYSGSTTDAFVPAEFDLTAFAGNMIRLRFHVGWDCGDCVTEEGWYLDDVVIEATPAVCSGPCIPADRDCDHDVDGIDFSTFASCFNGAGNPPRTFGCNASDQGALDFDDDLDVDGIDFSSFASCFNGAGNPPRTLNCPQS
jgi:hypothetical protein